MVIKESFHYKPGKVYDGKKYKNIVYIEADSSNETFQVKDIIKSYGALWHNKNKWWYWDLGNNPDEVIETKVKPCIEKLTEFENGYNDVKREVKDIINALIAEVKNATMPNIPGMPTKEDLMKQIEGYKKELMSIVSDEEFKKKFESIIKFRNAFGANFSFMNCLLIMIQDPEATMVKSAKNWKYVNRKVKDNAKAIILRVPKGKDKYNKEEKKQIEIEFLQSKGVKTIEDLTPGDRERLRKKLKEVIVYDYDMGPWWFDYRFTEQIPDTEDLVGSPNIDLEWHDNDPDESPRLLEKIRATVAVIEDEGIPVTFEELHGPMGVSKNGKISIEINQTKKSILNTLTHEFSHEILHQEYIKSKNEDMIQYFIGTKQGRNKVEQQAELCAWIVMRCYGYNMQTNINYVGIWGMDENNCVEVFDAVSNAANYIVKKVLEEESINVMESKIYLKESEVPSGFEIAKMVGCGNIYKKSAMRKRKNHLTEKQLNSIIRESIKKVLNESYQISLAPNGKVGYNNAKLWQSAINELQTKGEVIINIPLDYNQWFNAELRKTERNTIYLSCKGLNKEFTSINDAVNALQYYAQQKANY